MKSHPALVLLLSLAAVPLVRATEQLLIPWNHTWKYFQPMSDDPSLDDAAIDNTGVGIAPNAGPDLIYTNFNGTTDPAGAWFAKESDFTGPNGYAAVFGTGFNLNGPHVGDINNYSSYDSGEGPGPIGYDVMDYFSRGLEFTAFATAITKTPTTRRFASYYRTTFTVAQEFNKPRIRMLLDDNAVIYYDGVLVAYVNRTNSTITYTDVGSTDTTAVNNEEFEPTSTNNERVMQTFFLNQAGGPLSVLTAGARADSFVASVVPRITPGEHTIAVIVRNSGNDSSDMGFAFQLYGDDAGISAIVNSTSRQDNGTPADPSDDTITGSITVTRLGTASTSWTSDITPVQPAPYVYDTAFTFGPFPATAPQVINFTADGDPALTAQATLTPPPLPSIVGTNNLAGGSLITIASGNAGPWTQMPGLPADKRIQLNNGNSLAGISTDPITLTPGTPKAITVLLDYNDNSTGSNAETADSIKVELVTNVGTINLTSTYDADGTSPANGSAMNGDDTLLYEDELNPDSLPEDWTFTAHWMLAGIIPANATTVQVRISASNDSASETFRVGNIVLKPHVDTDGDGVFDIFEEVAGTDPNNAVSWFREVSHSITTTQATITVTSVSTRAYEFQASTDLSVWTRAVLPAVTPPQVYEPNTPGNDSNLDLTRPLVDSPRTFGRILVHLPTTDIASP